MSYQRLVEQHHRLTFQQNIRLATQQVTNPLRSTVTITHEKGEAIDVADLIDAEEYSEGEDRSRRNPENIPNQRRRWIVRPELALETGQYIDKAERWDKAMDPSSNLILNKVRAVERGVGDRILGVRKTKGGAFELTGRGILGGAIEGKTPGSRVEFPAANRIGVTEDGSAVGLTLKKLRAATEAMELEDFGLETDEEIHSLITPRQKTDLLNLAFETGKSLNPFEVEQIREGKAAKLLGINWHFTNRLPVNKSGHRIVPLWTKANVVANFWEDVEGDMWNDTHAKNTPYIFVDAQVDATRVEDGGVRVIECAEAAAE